MYMNTVIRLCLQLWRKVLAKEGHLPSRVDFYERLCEKKSLRKKSTPLPEPTVLVHALIIFCPDRVDPAGKVFIWRKVGLTRRVILQAVPSKEGDLSHSY